MRLFFKNNDLIGFSRWVILGGNSVVVEKPQKLKKIVYDFAKEINKHLFSNH